MKKLLLLTFICILLFTGCSQEENKSETVTPAVTSAQTDSLTDTVEATADLSDKSNISTGNTTNGDVVEITEKLFIAQTNDIYYNNEDYLGKTIKYEGIFDFYTSENGTTYYYVIRYGPGCCGNDGTAGFEVVWDNDYPEQNEWVEAVGVLETYEENGKPYLRLHLTSLTILDERGAENVTT